MRNGSDSRGASWGSFEGCLGDFLFPGSVTLGLDTVLAMAFSKFSFFTHLPVFGFRVFPAGHLGLSRFAMHPVLHSVQKILGHSILSCILLILGFKLLTSTHWVTASEKLRPPRLHCKNMGSGV